MPGRRFTALFTGALLVLLLVLSGSGRVVWLSEIRPESGLAWTAPLPDATLDEDGRSLGAALFEFTPAPGVAAWACRQAGPAAASFCPGFWHALGPGRQLHDTIRQHGGGRFSVWHGTLYFSVPDGGDARGRALALWLPGSGPSPSMPPLGLLAWAGLLLAGLQMLPRLRRIRWPHAIAWALAGFAAAEIGLGLALPRLGLVADLQQSQMLKYLVETRSDKPILLLVGSSLTQYGIDEPALETALAREGHAVTVLRLGFGGMSIPERLYYLRKYLASTKTRPVAVLFEISRYYDQRPLQQLAQNPFSRREIAALDPDNLGLSLAWLRGPDGDPALAGPLLADFALHELQVGVLPKSAWWAELEPKPFRVVPPKTEHDPDETVAAELAAIGHGDAPPTPITAWTQQAIDAETGLFRAAGVTRFGFYATPSRYAPEWRYARDFCREQQDYPCLPAEDPALLAALGQDRDWLDQTHLQGEGRAHYTALAGRPDCRGGGAAVNFVSGEFALFLAATWLLHWLLPTRLRKPLLLVASYLFYAAWDWRFCGLMAFVSANAWLAGRFVRDRCCVLGLSIGVDLAVLAWFKYAGFLAASVSAFGLPVTLPPILLPIGISFYTFHAISYVVDVRRGRVPPARAPLDVALYIAFFPQLVAGPILRAAFFLPQLRRPRPFSGIGQSQGLRLILKGLIYKALIADFLAGLADPAFGAVAGQSDATLAIAAIAFYGQIYFDFAGYSALAIGTARLFGYRIPKNFDYPYSALSLTEFWRRWHMSLSFWLRDYVYIPLGGNRAGSGRVLVNILITMVLGGLWHGASWNFVLWGALHGAGLCLHKLWQRLGFRLDRLSALIATQLWVLCAWIPFRCADLHDTRQVLAALLHVGLPVTGGWILLLIAADHALGRGRFKPGLAPSLARPVFWLGFGGLAALVLASLPLAEKAFLYFQF